jgi:DNA helicase HerA-like ATPase
MSKQENTITIWWDIFTPGENVDLFLKRANRHGLISWATGTWKTVTLQILAEEFSKAGVPVFASDVKWDLAWIAVAWKDHPKVQERLEHIWIKDWNPKSFPTILWDLYWEKWHPIRTTPTEMWPLLLSRIMDLSDTQDALLHIAFKIADDNWWLILDLDDIEAILWYMDENRKTLRKYYWTITWSSLWAIRRDILVLREAWVDKFFWETALDLGHIMKRDFNKQWIINILDASKLISDSRLYSTFLLWLISELFEQLPEVWDLDKPKLVFFFDEAHLLFRDAPKILVEKIEQVVRLIRSKWVWIYFVTQNPTDIPETVRSQLWNRIQHALRAFTPKDQKAIKVVAETFRQNEQFDIKEALTQMSVWVWLVSCLDEKWRPQVVEKTLIRPPQSRMWPLTNIERKEIINRSPFLWLYEKRIDRESADEILEKLEDKVELEKLAVLEQEKQKIEDEKNIPLWQELLFWNKKKKGFVQTVGKSIIRKAGNKVATKIVRGIFGSLLK